MNDHLIATASKLLQAQSRYRLEVWDCPDYLDVLSFHGNEALSQPYRYRVHFTCSNRDLSAEQLLLKEATFTLQTPAFSKGASALPVRAVHGLIRDFKRISSSADEARYQIELVPRLALLANQQRSAIYQQQTVPEIVEQVLRQHQFEGPDFEFRLTREYPVRELVTQWRESDLAFVQRLLAELGIYYRFEMDAQLQREVLVFSDSQLHYQFDVHLPLRDPSGLNGNAVDSVWGLKLGQQVVPQSVQTHDYNYRDARDPLLSSANLASRDTTTYGEVRHYAEPFRIEGDPDDTEPESGLFYARLRHERLLNDQHRVSGHSSSPTLIPGQVLEIDGGTPASLHDGLLITAIGTSGARDRSFSLILHGQPYSETVCFRPAVPPRPRIPGTLPARVASREPNDTYAWLDNQGRYRVKVHFDQDDWAPGEAYLWVRLAKPYAGDTYGWHAPLLDGTEVALAFDGGDCDRPYIAYALHDSEHPDPVTDANFTRNVLRTPANNKLRLEDKRGEEHIKLATEHGKSQLNLGHIVDATRKPRGEGFELRTDNHGALRAGRGLYLSAHEQAKAHGPMLEMEPALAQLKQANGEMQALNETATQAAAVTADIQRQLDLAQTRLAQLQSAVLLASAPEGVALTSGEHLQLAARQNLMVNAGQNADIGVMKNFFIGVGESFGVFVQKLGMKLIANQGKVEVAAQNNAMTLTSKLALTITSTDDEIIISTPKKLRLNGGGSYLEMDETKIEHGSAGDFTVKCARYVVPTQGAQQQSEMPVFDKTTLDEVFPLIKGSFSR